MLSCDAGFWLLAILVVVSQISYWSERRRADYYAASFHRLLDDSIKRLHQ